MIPWLVMYVGAFVANIIEFEQKSVTLTGNTARRFEWN
jgi:hypothetical protein